MPSNPFTPNLEYENDPEGLVLPYKLTSRTDLELIEDKYKKLVKSSYGYIVRLGIRVY